jgi:hypothetical protein
VQQNLQNIFSLDVAVEIFPDGFESWEDKILGSLGICDLDVEFYMFTEESMQIKQHLAKSISTFWM